MRKMTVLRWRNKKRNRRCMYCTRYKKNSGYGGSSAYGKCTGKLLEVQGVDRARRCPLFDLDMKEDESDVKE